MRIEPGASDANLRHALELVARAADAGAQVVLLPEALPCGWTHPSARADAGPIPEGPACLALREAARRHRLYLCSGLVERAGDKLYNAALLLGPRGELLLHHRKIHELDIARDLYARGDRLHVAP
jgi:predicted amidohydrolase